MSEMPGMVKPDLQALPQIKDRMTFIYLERCKINRQDGAITVTIKQGVTYIPAGAISVLLLGPGCSITHRAIELIGDAGVSVVWVGEKGVRFYAGGRPMTHRAGLLLKQAELVSNQRKHLDVVRKMYVMRFPDEDVSKLTLQQLRGREGARIRKVYREMAKKWDVEWNGREYDPEDYLTSNPVNQALSVGNACLYGLAHSVIFSLGCSPGLGFVHVGHDCSFVYDIADLYKAEIVIPIAFQAASLDLEGLELEGWVRRSIRDKMTEMHLLEKMVKDIKYLLSEENTENVRAVYLWDDKEGQVENGISY
jgi:CRISPR-associated protein Cas1